MQTPEDFMYDNRIFINDAFTRGHLLIAIRARDAEWQARVDRLEAAMEYALACLPDAPLNAKDKLRAALGRE